MHVRRENGKYVIFYKKPIYVGEVPEDELDDYEKEKCNDHLIIMKWLSSNHGNAARHHRMTNAEFMVDHGLEFHNLKWSYTERHNKIVYSIKPNSNAFTDLMSKIEESQFFPFPVDIDARFDPKSLTEILVCYERGEPRSTFITDWLDCPFDATELDLNFKISLLAHIEKSKHTLNAIEKPKHTLNAYDNDKITK